MRFLRFILALSVVMSLVTVRDVQAQPDLITLHVTTSPDDAATPLLYAEHAGMFRKVGLDIVVQRTSSGSAAAAAVVSGAVEIGHGSLLPIITAHAKGVPLVLIAPSTLHISSDPDSGILVMSDSTVRAARDLSGKVVSVGGLFDLNWLATKAWIDANGGSSDAVQFIEVPNSAVLPALEAGRITGGTLSEPFMSVDLDTGKVRYLGNIVDGIGKHLIESGWYATKQYATEHRDVLDRFQRVVEQATAYTNTHHAETVDLLASFSGMDIATIAKTKRAVCGTTLDPREIQPMIDVAAKYKVIPATFPARDLLLGTP
jgi:ABC-type nitrate/sulfonate/bicarbonate transport system substrate-binding protein